MGIPIDGSPNVFYDIVTVYKNATQLKKKQQLISFHQTRECMALDIMIVHKVDMDENLANLLTKSLPTWKRVKFRSTVMHSNNPS